MLREPRSRWPRSVENKGVPQLNMTPAIDDIAVTFVNHATFLIQIGGMKPIHMNPAEAVRAHGDLGAKHSIGMHFGTFQLTPEAIHQPQADLEAALSQSGISDREFVTLHEGETRIYRMPPG